MKLTEFDCGWFNAFSTFFDEIYLINNDAAFNYGNKVLKSASITSDEIKSAIDENLVSDYCMVLLKDYQSLISDGYIKS